MEFLFPIATMLYALYAVGDFLLDRVLNLFRPQDFYDHEDLDQKPSPKGKSLKRGAPVVDSFSDTFKLPTPQFED